MLRTAEGCKARKCRGLRKVGSPVVAVLWPIGVLPSRRPLLAHPAARRVQYFITKQLVLEQLGNFKPIPGAPSRLRCLATQLSAPG